MLLRPGMMMPASMRSCSVGTPPDLAFLEAADHPLPLPRPLPLPEPGLAALPPCTAFTNLSHHMFVRVAVPILMAICRRRDVCWSLKSPLGHL